MKTTTDLFLAFTKGRKPVLTYGPDDIFANARVYDISIKQYQWLVSLIFKKFDRVNHGGALVSPNQYSEDIDGFSYSLVGNKKMRIRVWPLSATN